MQGQLREASQGGRQEETEADRAQGIGRSAAQETVYRVKKLVRDRRKGRAKTYEDRLESSTVEPYDPHPEYSVSGAGGEPSTSSHNRESAKIKTRNSTGGSPSMEHSRIDSGKSELLQIKTKDACVQRRGLDTQLREQQPAAKDACPPDRQPVESVEPSRQKFIHERQTAAKDARIQFQGIDMRLREPKSLTNDAVPSDHQSSQPTERGRQKFIQERQAAAIRQTKGQQGIERPVTARQQNRVDIPFQQAATRSGQSESKPAKKVIQGTVSNGKRQIKAARSGVRATGRTSRQTVKTAERTARTTAKTAGRGVKTAQKTAKATVKATRQAVQAARATAQTAATTTKAVAKAAVSAIKAAIAAAQEVAAAIAAGGGAVIAVVLVLCLAGALLLSPLGIFFSGEDNGTSLTISSVVREINQEYGARVETLKTGTAHDELSLNGSRATWPEILAVYAVKTTSDPTNGLEVVTMDDTKKELLKQVFWDMNELSSFTSTVPGEGDDEENTTTLHITVTAKTASEMADVYGFSTEQRRQLAELLSDEYRELWSAVLYGIGAGDGEIVAVALSQVGNVGGQPYWSWYGFGSRVDWCAIFVSWCANECGYIDAGVVPKFAGCVQGSRWFKERELWQDRSYTPNPGDVIFFDWDDPGGFSGPQDGLPDHVGIVERVENGRVYTIEGNSGDQCRQRSYPMGHYEIYGYGIAHT